MYSMFFFFKQKTAYEMRISDWSSDVCSSDLLEVRAAAGGTVSEAGGTDEDALGISIVIDHGHGVTSTYGHLSEIGRASCRERVCQYVSISVVAVSLNKKTQTTTNITYPR